MGKADAGLQKLHQVLMICLSPPIPLRLTFLRPRQRPAPMLRTIPWALFPLVLVTSPATISFSPTGRSWRENVADKNTLVMMEPAQLLADRGLLLEILFPLAHRDHGPCCVDALQYFFVLLHNPDQVLPPSRHIQRLGARGPSPFLAGADESTVGGVSFLDALQEELVRALDLLAPALLVQLLFAVDAALELQREWGRVVEATVHAGARLPLEPWAALAYITESVSVEALGALPLLACEERVPDHEKCKKSNRY